MFQPVIHEAEVDEPTNKSIKSKNFLNLKGRHLKWVSLSKMAAEGC